MKTNEQIYKEIQKVASIIIEHAFESEYPQNKITSCSPNPSIKIAFNTACKIHEFYTNTETIGIIDDIEWGTDEYLAVHGGCIVF